MTHVRLDHRVAGGTRGVDPVAAVLDEEGITVTDQAHRRSLATLLQPAAVQLHSRRVEAATATVAESNLGERNPRCRCERRVCCMAPPSRSSRRSSRSRRVAERRRPEGIVLEHRPKGRRRSAARASGGGRLCRPGARRGRGARCPSRSRRVAERGRPEGIVPEHRPERPATLSGTSVRRRPALPAGSQTRPGARGADGWSRTTTAWGGAVTAR